MPDEDDIFGGGIHCPPFSFRPEFIPSNMKTWADIGMDHVQFNMVDDATLRAAQRDPEQYQEVIVRVAGYSAHFMDISSKTQDSILQRTV